MNCTEVVSSVLHPLLHTPGQFIALIYRIYNKVFSCISYFVQQYIIKWFYQGRKDHFSWSYCKG